MTRIQHNLSLALILHCSPFATTCPLRGYHVDVHDICKRLCLQAVLHSGATSEDYLAIFLRSVIFPDFFNHQSIWYLLDITFIFDRCHRSLASVTRVKLKNAIWSKGCNRCFLEIRTTPITDKLTHWGRVSHICVSRLTITGSDNGLPPGRRQAIIWTNAGILLIGSLGTNSSENSIEILTFSFTKMRLKVSFAKWRPFCLGFNVLKDGGLVTPCLGIMVSYEKDNWFCCAFFILIILQSILGEFMWSTYFLHIVTVLIQTWAPWVCNIHDLTQSVCP